jgi:hypothetical protein
MLWRVATVASLACFLLGSSAGRAAAEGPVRVGWWFEPQSKHVAVPVAPPVVPPRGLVVLQLPTGAAAYGAVRYAVPDAASSTLTLAVVGVPVAVATHLAACRTITPWTAPVLGAGAWEDRPAYSHQCAPSVIVANGRGVLFLLDDSFVVDGAVDVAVVPSNTDAEAVAFQPPGGGSLSFAVARADLPVNGGGPAAPAVVGGTPSSLALAFGGSPSLPGGGQAIRVPGQALAASPASLVSGAAIIPRVARHLRPHSDDAFGGAVAIIAAAVVAAGWVIASRRDPAPKLIGVLADTEPNAASSRRPS